MNEKTYTIRPLTWRRGEGYHEASLPKIGKTYDIAGFQIEVTSDGKYNAYFACSSAYACHNIGRKNTLSEAKKACQRVYEEWLVQMLKGNAEA
jgi:hypothetical protein